VSAYSVKFQNVANVEVASVSFHALENAERHPLFQIWRKSVKTCKLIGLLHMSPWTEGELHRDRTSIEAHSTLVLTITCHSDVYRTSLDL